MVASQRSRFGFIVLVVAIALATLSAAAQGGTIRHDRTQSQYLELGASPLYASVGRIDTIDVAGGAWLGSGTLITSEWVLTAAHVVEDSKTIRFTVGGATYTSDAWVMHSSWDGDLSAGYDIALVHLASTVTNVTPARRYTGSSELNGQATMVGYGMTGTGVTGATTLDNQKRAGNNIIDQISNGRILRYDFDSPLSAGESRMGATTPLNLEFLIAGGDSGGGTFLTFLGQTFLIGVHSFVSSIDGSGNSDYGDAAGDIRVSAFNSWIDSVIGQPLANLASGDYGLIGGSAFALTTGGSTGSELVAAPEPATLSLMLLGLAVVARRRRR